MENLISVIIPVYNVEPYLEKCIKSVLEQTFANFELILIDDGSTDNSGIICDELAKTDKRIIVFHQENEGLSAARNKGIDVSRGDYLYFLDSDDWIEPNALERLLSVSIKQAADISCCKSRDVYLNEVTTPITNTEVIIKDYYLDEIVLSLIKQNNIRFEVWDKLWKRSLIADTRFIKGQVAEDVHFDRILFLRANKISCTNEILHNYLKNRPGNTQNTFKIKRMCIFDELSSWVDDLDRIDKPILANAVCCIGCKFAISMFCDAKRHSQKKSVLKTIRSNYNHFYPRAKHSMLFSAKKLLTFRFFPNLSFLIAEKHRKTHKK